MTDINKVNAPGGPIDKEQATLVDVAKSVNIDLTGKVSVVSKIKGAPNSKLAAKMQQKDFVLTPGGYRHRSLVHKVEKGNGLERKGRDVHVKNLSTNTIVESPVAFAVPADLPALGSGWIAYAYWNNGTGNSLTSFGTQWIVPPAPTTPASQTIFLFNGIQNYGTNYGILQPVLQWGVSAAGGGQYWAVACWYVTADGHAYHTNPIQVNSGDTITGIMTLTGQSGSQFTYNCEFQGIPDTLLTIQNIAELLWCNETLEAYSIDTCSNYPATNVTAMSAINIEAGATAPLLNWTPVNTVQDCGQHCIVVNNSSTNGEVDIYYNIVA